MPHTMRRTRAGRIGFVVAAGTLVTLFGGPAADAHSILVSSSPAKNSSITHAPARVTLTFNETLSGGFTELTVLGPDGASHWEAGAPAVVDDTVSAPLRALGPAGGYAVHYRVVSADGHPVSGTVPFTLTVPGTGAPATPSAAAAHPPADPSPAGGSFPVWPWIAAAAIAVGTGLALARRLARG